MLNPLTLAAPTQHLRQLTVIRSLLLMFLWAGLGASYWFMQTPVELLATVLMAMSLITVFTFARLRLARPVTEWEFFIHLLADVASLILLFFCSGGANNPFISYLLVPVCISAATLPWRFTWAITGLSLLAYTGLLFYYREFPLFAVDHMHQHSRVNGHILGMWFNFFISATLITYFVVKMAKTLREQQEAISQLREDELRNEQLMAVAMLAAGAAHEINTPLSTMTVLLRELRDEYKNQPNLQTDLELLSQQVNHCATRLKNLVNHANAASLGKLHQKTLIEFCKSLIDRWQLMRPNIHFTVDYAGDDLEKIATLDPRLDLAIINLLNNAADASPQSINIGIKANNNALEWIIDDQGAGIDQQAYTQIGKATYTTKENGLGLGMVITHATLKSFGGTVTQTPRNPQGTRTHIQIPVA